MRRKQRRDCGGTDSTVPPRFIGRVFRVAGLYTPGVVTCESGGKGSGSDVACLWPDEKEMRAARVGEKGTRLTEEVG